MDQCLQFVEQCLKFVNLARAVCAIAVGLVGILFYAVLFMLVKMVVGE